MGDAREELLRAAAAAFNGEPASTWEGVLAPDAEVVMSPDVTPEPQVYVGPDGVRRLHSELLEAWEDMRIEIERVDPGADGAVATTTIAGVARGSGVQVVQRWRFRFLIRDGLIRRIDLEPADDKP